LFGGKSKVPSFPNNLANCMYICVSNVCLFNKKHNSTTYFIERGGGRQVGGERKGREIVINVELTHIGNVSTISQKGERVGRELTER
jgi:hypothetical protein